MEKKHLLLTSSGCDCKNVIKSTWYHSKDEHYNTNYSPDSDDFQRKPATWGVHESMVWCYDKGFITPDPKE